MCPFVYFLLQAVLLARLTFTQTVVSVTVGDDGSFFTPQVVTARNGDLISFKWTGMFHSVTQSSFDDPCTPLNGGFDSGVTGNPPNQMIIPEWNLTITDDSQPIWFFCKMTVPVSHCTSGMVGAINAIPTGTNNSFDLFLQKAKSLTNPPLLPKGVPPSLTGIGASASSTPIPLFNQTNTTSSTVISSSSSSSTSSFTVSSTTSVASSSQTTSTALTAADKGGIAGGIIGAIVLTSIIILAGISYCRARKYRREALMANQMLQDKEAEPEFVQIGRQARHRVVGSNASMSESTDADGSATVNALNIKELAAEIAKNIRQEADPQGGTKSMTGPRTVPESVITQSLPDTCGGFSGSETLSTRLGTESIRGTESTRSQVRQLPRPPNQSRRPLRQSHEDDVSVETLPAYPRYY